MTLNTFLADDLAEDDTGHLPARNISLAHDAGVEMARRIDFSIDHCLNAMPIGGHR
jgi:hypothetical protein